MTIEQIKSELKNKCLDLLEEKITETKFVINEYQEEANNLVNSSEDKFDSAKEDYQNKKEAHKRQLGEHLTAKMLVNKIPVAENTSIVLGSIIETNEANYFISANIGVHDLEVDKKKYIPITFASPISKQFREMKLGETKSFLNRKVTLINII